MRILAFAGGSAVFGAERVTLDILRQLAARGHTVHCVANGWNDGDFPARLRAAGLSHETMKLGWVYVRRPAWTADTAIHYPAALARCLRLRREFRPDVVYHQSYRTAVTTPFAHLGARTAIHVHDADVTDRTAGLAYRWLRSRATFVATSEFVRREVTARGIAESRVVVAYPPVCDEHAHDGPANAGPEAQSGTAPPRPRIGMVGQLIPRKGHEDLLRALATLQSRYDFAVDVFGRGSEAYLTALQQLTDELGLTDRVEWHGYGANRSDIYRRLAIAVVPTRDREPFGLAAAEPALWGVPVVASAGGGLLEIVRDGETGLLCRPGDPADLAAKIACLLDSPELRARLARCAASYVRSTFTVDRATTAVEQALGAA
jgi:glycosyltransferase involved in cell wall biosynthesis